jgi:alpha-mannosidase
MKLCLSSGKSSLDDISLSGDPSIILDSIKRGEDDEDVSLSTLKKRTGQSIILRVFESLGGQASGTIKAKFQVKRAWKCNLLEDDQEPLHFQGRELQFTLRAFEIATFRLQL